MLSPGLGSMAMKVVPFFFFYNVIFKESLEGKHLIYLLEESFHLLQMSTPCLRSQILGSESKHHEDTSRETCWLLGTIILHEIKQTVFTFLPYSQ